MESENTITIQDVVWVGGNRHGYYFGICRLHGNEWHGFAKGDQMIFFFPTESEADQRQALIKMVAYANSEEACYGGITGWTEEFAADDELKSVVAEDFKCAECRRIFCEGECFTNFYNV